MKKIIKYQYGGGSNGPPFSKRVYEVEGEEEENIDINDDSQNTEDMNKDEKIIDEIHEKENLLSDEFIVKFINNYSKRKEVLEKDFNKDELIMQFLKQTEETMDLQNIEKNDENKEVIEELSTENIEINEDIVENAEEIEPSIEFTDDQNTEEPTVEYPTINIAKPEGNGDFEGGIPLPEIPLIVPKVEDDNILNTMNEIKQLESLIEVEKQKLFSTEKQEEEPKGFFKKLFYLFDFKTKREQTIFSIYMLPPVIISLISMVHVKTLFALVNNDILAWVLAASFELAALASLFSLKMLNKINSVLIWSLIFIIIGMQTAGNMYAAFAVINAQDGMIVKLLQLFGLGDDLWSLRFVSFLLGGTLPVIAFLFIKSISEYLDNSDEEVDY